MNFISTNKRLCSFHSSHIHLHKLSNPIQSKTLHYLYSSCTHKLPMSIQTLCNLQSPSLSHSPAHSSRLCSAAAGRPRSRSRRLSPPPPPRTAAPRARGLTRRRYARSLLGGLVGLATAVAGLPGSDGWKEGDISIKYFLIVRNTRAGLGQHGERISQSDQRRWLPRVSWAEQVIRH